MKAQDYTTTITVNATAGKAFESINNVTKWWTDDFRGSSHKLNDEFTVQFGDIHRSTQKLIEVVSNKKIVWLVTESRLSFIDKKNEWNDSKIVFEIFENDGKTQVRFTHVGLMPEIECFGACSTAWGQYINGSLLSLINTGEGKPTLKASKKVSMK